MKEFTVLEDQIRECFGRAVYTHKTHEKMADIQAGKLKTYKGWQFALAAITSSGLIAIIAFETFWLKLITAGISLVTTYVTSVLKDRDLGADAQKHRDAASKIWNIRESYLSLLTDLRMSSVTDDSARSRRDQLQTELAQIYVGAPQTNGDAYQRAQTALKDLEDYTFAKDEINKFLPDSLKKP